MNDDMDKILDAMGEDIEDEDIDALLQAMIQENEENTWVPSSEKEAQESEEEPPEEPLEYVPAEEREARAAEEAAAAAALEAAENPEEVEGKKGLVKVLLGGTLSRASGGLTSVKAGMKNAKQHNAKLYKIATLLGVGTVAVLGLVIVLAIIASDDSSAISPNVLGAQAQVHNRAGSTFLNAPVAFENHMITLGQVMLDSSATVFNFEGEIDLSQYAFKLIDENGHVYSRDFAFATNPARQGALNQTSVRFEPVDPYAGLVTLFVTHIESGREVEVYFAYAPDSVNAGRFFNYPIAFDNANIEGVNVSIAQAHFSASGSSVSVNVDSNLADSSIVFKPSGNERAMSMRHRIGVIPAVNGDLHVATFDDGSILARMDFDPLTALNDNVEITLRGLHRLYNLGYTIPVSEIFTTATAREYHIQLSQAHQMTIRGLTRQGDVFVMPMFGEARYTHVALNEYDMLAAAHTRMATHINAYLVTTDATGTEHRLPGRVNFDARGTDVIFDARLNPAFERVSPALMRLEIETVSVALPEVSHTLQLSSASTENTPNHHMQALYNHLSGEVNIVALQSSGQAFNAIVLQRMAAVQNGQLREEIAEMIISGTINDAGEVTIISQQVSIFE